MGHLASKAEIVSIIRRFDTDGDAKVNLAEFSEAIKSQLSQSQGFKVKKKLPQYQAPTKLSLPKQEKSRVSQSFISTPSKRQSTPGKLISSKVSGSSKKKRPMSAGKAYGA